ncbi:HNH endonuclease [Macrococcoides goetzii]|uniref:HNH endonuclease n=1 Tax=Macrococcus sp. PK TaxID=2801919 RepID=UPI001F10E886|nr:HNH endonuclease [Macrococcus sp. PK]MCH4983831.1 HNH endonuclease [Macrococcus sp. PK]
MFRKISANDSDFNIMKNKHRIFLKSYELFVENTKLGYTKGVTKSSGKARSYRDYLIRLFLIVEDFTKINIDNPASTDVFGLVENIKNIDGYKEFNNQEGRFPNAALNYYISFVSQILIDQETEIDNLSDQLIDSKQNTINNSKLFIENDIKSPEIRPEPITVNNVKRYRRNLLEVRKAKVSANYVCEYDNKHVTFENNYDNKPYIEAHHLIPMAAQGLFKYNIDFADNIICLCPNCHRRIHYGVKSDKIEMVQKFYKDRHEKIESFKVEIKYNDLKLFYNIK